MKKIICLVILVFCCDLYSQDLSRISDTLKFHYESQDSIIKAIKEAECVKYLTIMSCCLDVDALKNLELPCLVGLEIHSIDLPDLTFLQNFKTLKKFELVYSEVEEIDFNLIPETILELKIEKRSGTKLLNIEKKFPNLEVLYLDYEFSNEDISSLADQPNLRELSLFRNKEKEIIFSKEIASLENLSIMFSRMKRLTGLEHFPNLKVMRIEYNGLKEFPAIGVPLQRQIESLSVRSNDLEGEIKMDCASLRILDISGNEFTKVNLSNVSYPFHLDVSYNDLSRLDFMDESASMLAVFLFYGNPNLYVNPKWNLTNLIAVSIELGKFPPIDIRTNKLERVYIPDGNEYDKHKILYDALFGNLPRHIGSGKRGNYYYRKVDGSSPPSRTGHFL